MTKSNSFVYAYVDSENLPSYIGKGEGYRANKHAGKAAHNKELHEAIVDNSLTLTYLAIDLTNSEAEAVEAALIKIHSPRFNKRQGLHSKRFFGFGERDYLHKPKSTEPTAKDKAKESPVGILARTQQLMGNDVYNSFIDSIPYKGSCYNNLIARIRREYNITSTIHREVASSIALSYAPSCVVISEKGRYKASELLCSEKQTRRILVNESTHHPMYKKVAFTARRLSQRYLSTFTAMVPIDLGDEWITTVNELLNDYAPLTVISTAN